MRQIGTRQKKVLSHGHGGNYRKMLINHPDTEFMSVVRAANLSNALTDDDLTGVCQMISHDAFDQRAFPGSVLAQQSVESARLKFQGDLFIGDKRAKPLGDLDKLKSRRPIVGRTWPHVIAAMKASELETAPKTPPCILIMCRAAR